MLERSDAAPPSWGIEHTEAAIVGRLLDLDPDLVFFQELPGLVPYLPTHGLASATPESHQGHLATLVRSGLRTDAIASSPFVVLVTLGDLTVANVHLAPGPGAEPTRRRLGQLQAIVEASPTDALVIVGDTNTRAAEVGAVEALGLHTVTPPEPTWDSRRNRFRSEGPRFTAHFTRWFATPDVVVDDVEVLSEPEVVEGRRFHLSDHHALALTVRTTPSS